MSERKHGGRRKGAGRKPSGEPRKQTVCACGKVGEELVQVLDQAARRRGISRSLMLGDAVLMGLYSLGEIDYPAQGLPSVRT